MSELKPCPFCGGRAKLIVVNNQYQVMCDGYACLAKQGWWERKDYAINAWNRRAE